MSPPCRSDTAEAIRKIEGGHTTGKIVVTNWQASDRRLFPSENPVAGISYGTIASDHDRGGLVTMSDVILDET